MTHTRPYDKPPISRANLSDALAKDAQEMEDSEQEEQRYRLLALFVRQALLSIVAAIERCFDIPASTRTKIREEI